MIDPTGRLTDFPSVLSILFALCLPSHLLAAGDRPPLPLFFKGRRIYTTSTCKPRPAPETYTKVMLTDPFFHPLRR